MENSSNEKSKGPNIFSLDETFPEDEENFFSVSSNQLAVITDIGCSLASTCLPKNFFENLLILEMGLEEDFSLDKLIELVKQYSIAIEYYLQKNQKMAKAYQNRMEYLLTNKDILVKLKQQKNKNNKKINENNIKNIQNNNNNINNNLNINKEKKGKNIHNSKLFNKKESAKIKKDNINYEDLSKKVYTFLNQNIIKKGSNISGKKIINDDLEKQNLNWKEKLKQKKKNPSRFSIKPSIGSLKNKYFGTTDEDKSEPDLDNDPTVFNHNSNKSENNNNDHLEENKFNSIFEELYEIKEDDIIDEEKKEKLKEKEDLIKQVKIENINEETKLEDKKENHENLGFEDEENNNKKEEVEIKDKEEKNENVEEKNKEIESYEENQNTIKSEKQININQNNLNNPFPIIINPIESLDTNILIISPKSKEQNNNEILEKINPDQEIKSSIESQILSLQSIISHLDSKYLPQNEVDIEEEEDSEFSSSNQNLIKIKNNNNLIDKIPIKYQEIFSYIENIINSYLNDFNKFFYKDIFEQFSLDLQELYEMKYKKYIEVRNEYHNQIKENEYLLENDDNLTNEKKEEYQQTIESLNEEQQHQIGVIEYEFNKKIIDKISEFKRNSFKNNNGIQLLEEKVKLDVYSLINEAFY